jgi:hypothetical protein
MELNPATGFLICRDVALARTGEQLYAGHEVPLQPDARGFVTVDRSEEEVFSPETIKSFVGAPFTDDHPVEDVTTGNFKQHIVGTVLNARRGEGERANCMVGDIIVYDPDVIRSIQDGKREVSCGYNADYERVAPGRGRQVNIRGNHISLVQEGRCGPACSIQDRKAVMAKGNKSSFKDRMLAAFKARDAGDEAELAKQLEAASDEMKPEPEGGAVTEPEGPESAGAGNHHHVVVNIGGLEGGDKARDEDVAGKVKDEEGPDGDEPPDIQAMLADVVGKAVAPLMARLDALESAIEDVADPEDTATQDAVARAEVLKPGFKLPTFDAKPGSRDQKTALHTMKVAVLKETFATPEGRELVGGLVRDARPDFAKMTPREVDVIFVAASDRASAANNAPVAGLVARGGFGVRDESAPKGRRITDARGLNEYYAKHYGRA